MLSAVRDEIAAGTVTVAAIARHLDAPEDVVRAAVWHLRRAGEVSAAALASGCPDDACGSCAVGCGDRREPGKARRLLRRHSGGAPVVPSVMSGGAVPVAHAVGSDR